MGSSESVRRTAGGSTISSPAPSVIRQKIPDRFQDPSGRLVRRSRRVDPGDRRCKLLLIADTGRMLATSSTIQSELADGQRCFQPQHAIKHPVVDVRGDPQKGSFHQQHVRPKTLMFRNLGPQRPLDLRMDNPIQVGLRFGGSERGRSELAAIDPTVRVKDGLAEPRDQFLVRPPAGGIASPCHAVEIEPRDLFPGGDPSRNRTLPGSGRSPKRDDPHAHKLLRIRGKRKPQNATDGLLSSAASVSSRLAYTPSSRRATCHPRFVKPISVPCVHRTR